MNLGDNQSKLSTFLTLASFTLITAILYVAKAVFIPIALGLRKSLHGDLDHYIPTRRITYGSFRLAEAS